MLHRIRFLYRVQNMRRRVAEVLVGAMGAEDARVEVRPFGSWYIQRVLLYRRSKCGQKSAHTQQASDSEKHSRIHISWLQVLKLQTSEG